MKNTIIILIALILAGAARAQDVFTEIKPLDGIENLEFDLDFADQIIIKTWNKNEVSMKATVTINDNEDNDKYSMQVHQSGDKLLFEQDIHDLKEIGQTTTLQHGIVIHGNHHCIDMEIDYEIFMPAPMAFDLETISGNVEVIGHSGPMKIKTISGFIDLSVPENMKADFDMKTITGAMYSDLSLDYSKKRNDMRVFVGGDVEARLNGGGIAFRLETISGDIYLRKSQ